MINAVRLQEMEINNFKNVKNGKISFDSYKKKQFYANMLSTDILGIYGQNGSGKTSAVEAIEILRDVLLGKPVNDDIKKILSFNEEIPEFKFTFLIINEDTRYLVYYKFKLKYIKECLILDENEIDSIEDKIEICEESLKYSTVDLEKKSIGKVKGIIDINLSDSSDIIFRPEVTYKILTKQDEKNKMDLIISREMAKQNGLSFIFNKRSFDIFNKYFINENRMYFTIISFLRVYAREAFIIKNDKLGQSYLMPFSFRIQKDKKISRGSMVVKLFETNTLPIDHYDVLKEVVDQINIVLISLIPGLKITSKVVKEEHLEDGLLGKVFELFTVRDDIEVPLKYESVGIKKIMSILSALIAMYNNEGVCVVVDELDSGIFEFLLGELLEVLKGKAKGQLIFTSHNLRALEVLDKNDIIFTSINSENRYIKFKNVKNTNNLRDFYLREILLGEQDEAIYNRTKNYAISRAFRKAGIKYE